MTRAERIANIDDREISKLKGEEGMKTLRSYVSSLRQGYARRTAAFARRNIVSYAQIQFEENGVPSKVPLSKMSRSQLLIEYFRYQKFFRSETSSIEGARKVNREQDIRLFGANRRGTPKKTLTNAERTKYWALYNEYMSQYPNRKNALYSDKVQRILADMVFRDNLDVDDISKMFEDAEERLHSEYLEETGKDVPNIFSGRGPFIE